MNFNPGNEKKSSVDQYGKWLEECVELMRKGLDMCSTVTEVWLNSGRQSVGEKPGTALNVWGEWFTSLYKPISDMFSGTSEIPGYSIFKGKVPDRDIFGRWTQILTGQPVDFFPFRRGMEDFNEFSKSWQNSYMNLQKAWIECLENTATAHKSVQDKGEPGNKSLMAGTESSTELMNAWLKLADEQTRALFQFLKMTQPDLKSSVEKKSKKAKAAKAA